MGKRVDYSARTVITSDPNISIDQLGVPVKIAMNLTFPEVVTPNNIDRLTKLVRNGRYKYPGANFVIPVSSISSGRRYVLDLRYRKKTVKLRYGDIVERHVLNDDPFLFIKPTFLFLFIKPTFLDLRFCCLFFKIPLT